MCQLHWVALAVAVAAVGAALGVSLRADHLLPIILAFAFC